MSSLHTQGFGPAVCSGSTGTSNASKKSWSCQGAACTSHAAATLVGWRWSPHRGRHSSGGSGIHAERKCEQSGSWHLCGTGQANASEVSWHGGSLTGRLQPGPAWTVLTHFWANMPAVKLRTKKMRLLACLRPTRSQKWLPGPIML